MRFPHRSVQSIPSQPLPSILTTFPNERNQDGTSTEQSAGENSADSAGEGIELVPIERSNTTCGKMLSPGKEEKEVTNESRVELLLSTKPLPSIPKLGWGGRSKAEWDRLPVKKRVLVLVSIQVLMITTIGLSLMSIKGNSSDSESARVQSTSTGAPSPIPSSPPIARGSFALTLGNARQQSSSCLARNNESAAWSCTNNVTMQVNILPPPEETPEEDTNNPLVSSFMLPDPNRTTLYGGIRLGPIEFAPAKLTPAVDSSNPDAGPGYYFRWTYDRMILLSEEQMLPGGESSGGGGREMRPGDKPWLCFFNNTSIDGFVYTSQDSTVTNNVTYTIATNVTRELSPFPYAVRVIEQRLQNSTLPYCERREIGEDGDLIQARNAPKQLLSLAKPAFVLNTSAGNGTSRDTHKRQSTAAMNNCQCQWMVQ